MSEEIKSEGSYTVKQMQRAARSAALIEGLKIEGNNHKVGCLLGAPDMLLYACERITQLESMLSTEEGEV